MENQLKLPIKSRTRQKNEKLKMATGPPKYVSRHPPFGTNTTRTPRDKKKRCGFPCVGKRIPPTRFQITTPQQFRSRKAKNAQEEKQKNARRLSEMTCWTKTNLKQKSWESPLSRGFFLLAEKNRKNKNTNSPISKHEKWKKRKKNGNKHTISAISKHENGKKTYRWP